MTNQTFALTQCLAKTYGEKENKQKGRDVLTHCLIVGEVARELIKRMPKRLREALFPGLPHMRGGCFSVITLIGKLTHV